MEVDSPYVYTLRQKVDPLGNAGESIKIEQLLGVCGGLGAGPFADMMALRSKDAVWDSALNALYGVLNENLQKLSVTIADDKQLFGVICSLYNDAYLITKEEYDVAVKQAGGGKRFKQRGGNVRVVMEWVLGPFKLVFNLLATIVTFTGNSLSYITNKLLDTVSASATSGAIINKIMEIVNAGGNVPAQIDAYYATLIASADTANIITFIIFMSMMAGFIPTVTLSGLVTSILGLMPQGVASSLLYTYLQYINLFMLVPVEYSIISKTLRYVGQKAAGSNKAIQTIFTKISARYDPSNIENMYRVLYKKVTGKDYDQSQTVKYTILAADMSTKVIALSGINPGIYKTALLFAGNNPVRIRTTKVDGTYGDQAPDPRGAAAASSVSNAAGNNGGQGGGRRRISHRKHKSRRHSRRAHRKTHKHVLSAHQRKSSQRR